jgi:hypothetical protein
MLVLGVWVTPTLFLCAGGLELEPGDAKHSLTDLSPVVSRALTILVHRLMILVDYKFVVFEPVFQFLYTLQHQHQN